MPRPSPARALLCLTALAVLALAICTGSAAAISAKPRFLDPEAVRSRALADVEARLSAAEAPPGSAPLAGPPAGSGIEAPIPSGFEPNFLAASRYWSVPGDPASTLAWIEAHPPGGLPVKFHSSRLLDGVTPEPTIGFEFPPLSRLAEQRLLDYSLLAFEGHTVLEATSQADWILPHPASEVIPQSARTLLVSRHRPGGPRHSELIDNRNSVRHFALLLDSLEMAQPGILHCPRRRSKATVVELVFRNSAGRAVAEARQPQPASACQPMSLTIGGKPQKPLLEGSEFLRRLRGVLP